MELTFRPARPDDVAAAVPLIHSSGPGTFDYVFDVPGRGSAQDFLSHAFVQAVGPFSHELHTAVLLDGEIVGYGAAYDGFDTEGHTSVAIQQIIEFYGVWQALGVIRRGLAVERIILPPKAELFYIGHLGVERQHRGRGIGTRLVDHLLAIGAERGRITTALDVSVENPSAQKLYERLGFEVTRELVSRLSNSRGRVPDNRRMERPTVFGSLDPTSVAHS